MIRLLILSYLSLLLLGLTDNMRGPLFPEILKEFSLSDTMGSLYFSLSSLFGFLGGLASPWWSRRWGTVAALRLAIILCGLSQLGFSFAPSFFWLIISVLFFGFSLGLMGVIQNTLVVTLSPFHLRNRLISGLHSMYALASLLAPLVVSQLSRVFAEHNIWRFSFKWGAGLAGLVLLASWGSFPVEERKPARSERPDPRQGVLRQYYFAVIMASYVLAEILMSSRLALYMRREYQTDLTTSSYYMAGFFVALLSGRVFFALWAPRIALKKQLMLSLALSTLSQIAGLWIHPFWFVISGLFMAPFYPLMMVEIGLVFHEVLHQAVANAVAFSSLFVVGMHVAVGSLADQFGIKVAFALGPLFCMISFGMLLFHEKIFHRLQS